MAADPLAELATLPGISDAVASSRERIDQLLWDRSLRTKGAALRVDVARRDSRDSAALDGIEVSYRAWASGDGFDDSPLGRAAAGFWRLEEELPEHVDVWPKAPLQVLARLHGLVAADILTADAIGRPRTGDDADDPLRLKSLPDASSMKVRLAGIIDLATKPTEAPAAVQAAIIHAELIAIRPFQWGSGPVARAAGRLTLASRGLDPDLLVLIDSAIFSIGRSAYVDAIRSYLMATPEGVGRWIRFYCEACAVGARLSSQQLAELPAT